MLAPRRSRFSASNTSACIEHVAAQRPRCAGAHGNDLQKLAQTLHINPLLAAFTQVASARAPSVQFLLEQKE
jgi:hypothetical protein